MSPAIVPLAGTLEAQLSEPPAERLLAGNPQLQVRNYFADSSQQFFAGRWCATRGKWRVRYTENELCVMTAGRVVIESDWVLVLSERTSAAGSTKSEFKPPASVKASRLS